MESNSLGLFYRVLLRAAQIQPFNRGPIRRRLMWFFKKRISHPIKTTFHGVPFVFNLDNPTEQKALFGFYNNREVDYLIGAAQSGAPVFVDVGANSGFYSQIFLFHAAGGARVLSIEPNPEMCVRIKQNVRLIADQMHEKNLTLILEDCAVGDQKGAMFLDLASGPGGAHVVDSPTPMHIEVRVDRLLDVLRAHEIDRIDLLKIDVEGYEDRALIPFFDEADKGLFPKAIIIEHTSDRDWQGDLWGKLKAVGYQEVFRTRGNMVLRLVAR